MSRLEIIRSYYEPKLKKELSDYAKLGWESPEAQKLRFDAFLDNIDAEGKSLLDVGCGLGNLLEYITEKGLNMRYTGVDILAKMVDCAKGKGLSGEFHCLDIFKENPFGAGSFDIVYASGIFNLDLGNNTAFFSDAFCRFQTLARETIAFSLLDYRSPGREEGYAYFSPAEIIKTIESSACRPKRVQIIEQYLSNDFTVICEK